MRTGARGVPKPISTSGQTQTNSTCGSRRATNLSCTISPLYRQGSKPMHLLMTIVGFGNLVNGIPPSHAQFLGAFRQKQIDGQDIRGTSRAVPARPQDQKSLFGERPTPSHPVRPQIAATPCRAGAFLPPIEAGCQFESLRRARILGLAGGSFENGMMSLRHYGLPAPTIRARAVTVTLPAGRSPTFQRSAIPENGTGCSTTWPSGIVTGRVSGTAQIFPIEARCRRGLGGVGEILQAGGDGGSVRARTFSPLFL